MKNYYIYSVFILLIMSSMLISCSDDSNGPGEEPDTELGQLFVSSNTTPVLGVFDFSDPDNVTSLSFGIASDDADGLIYNPLADILYQASRSNNRLDIYGNLSGTEAGVNLSLNASSTTDFSNARKIAISGNSVVVAQDAAESNSQEDRFLVYQVSESSAALQNIYNPQMDLWDIQFDGDTFYAVQDNSDSLAVFNNLLSNANGAVLPDQRVQIEGIVRTHALFYAADADIMFMSDIGEASSDSDGAMHIITDFSSKLSTAGDGGTISLGDQIRIDGPATQLGNPVGVTYDSDAEIIFVAERAVDGGRILAFELPESSGSPAPFFSQPFSGAADVHFAN